MFDMDTGSMYANILLTCMMLGWLSELPTSPPHTFIEIHTYLHDVWVAQQAAFPPTHTFT